MLRERRHRRARRGDVRAGATIRRPIHDSAAVLDRLAREDFEPLIGRLLTLEWANGSAQLEVSEARAIRSPSPRAVPPFALVLRSGSGWRGDQGMYRLTHPALGPIDLFLVPIGPDATGGLCYEAVFN